MCRGWHSARLRSRNVATGRVSRHVSTSGEMDRPSPPLLQAEIEATLVAAQAVGAPGCEAAAGATTTPMHRVPRQRNTNHKRHHKRVVLGFCLAALVATVAWSVFGSDGKSKHVPWMQSLQ